MPQHKEYLNPTRNEFIKLLEKHFNDINIENNIHIDEMFSYVYSYSIKGSVDFKSRCQEFFALKRDNKAVSKITTEYWLSRGHSLEYANEQISNLQKARSKRSKLYWTNKGYNENDASAKIKEIQSSLSKRRYEKYTAEEISAQSVWSIRYWLNRGLTEDEAIKKSHERNYACREFWNSEEEYDQIRKIIGDKTRQFIKDNPEAYSSFFGSVSKEEINFFEEVKKHISEIIHHEFIVNIKKTNELEQGIIKYDGYYKCDDTLILIEYDGLYWHNQSYDEIKDRICLEFRKDVNGIIRISSDRVKSKNIIKDIQYAIEQIKSKECNRIKLY